MSSSDGMVVRRIGGLLGGGESGGQSMAADPADVKRADGPSRQPCYAPHTPGPEDSATMKVGVLQFFSWSRRVPLTTVYERAFSRIAMMDQTGYDCVWLAEHHFNTYSVCPSINVMAAHVAARTRNLRIGMAVSLAAFYNPLRLAEEVAMIDVLSGGRVNWGAGRGFDRSEFEAFGVAAEESSDRFRECVEIVLAAWRNERLAYEGRFWRYD